MGLLEEIFKPLIISVKSFILDVWLDFEYAYQPFLIGKPSF